MSIDDRGYPLPPSIEMPEFEYELPENPFLQRCAELEERVSHLEGMAGGLLHGLYGVARVLRDSPGFEQNEARRLLVGFAQSEKAQHPGFKLAVETVIQALSPAAGAPAELLAFPAASSASVPQDE